MFGPVLGLTPRQLTAAYGLAGLRRAGFLGQGRRVALIAVGSSVPRAGFAELSRCFKPWPTPHEHLVVGPKPAPGGEAALDPAMVALMAPRARIDVFESGPGVTSESDPEFLPEMEADLPRLINAALNPRNTGGKRVDAISMSLGWCEAALPRRVVAATEAALKRARKLGVSVFAGAGDAGSLGTYALPGQKPTCIPWPVQIEQVKGLPHLRPGLLFPGSSPYVTAVGGSELAIDGKVPASGAPRGGPITNEVVWNQRAPAYAFGSSPGWPDLFLAGGGGQSTFFTTREAPWERAIGLSGPLHKPDIAALAGRPYALGGSLGTSVASPLMAGAISVLDGYLAAHGAKPVGPLNPLVYRIAAHRKLYKRVFHDIVRGDNDLLGLGCCRAKKGYDEASGLGSLDIRALADALLSRRARLAPRHANARRIDRRALANTARSRESWKP